MSVPTPSTAAEIAPEWIETIRTMLSRGGVAFRAGAHHHTIEMQSVNDGEFRPLLLPKGGVTFSTAADRDSILRQLETPPPQ